MNTAFLNFIFQNVCSLASLSVSFFNRLEVFNLFCCNMLEILCKSNDFFIFMCPLDMWNGDFDVLFL
jgi:hypothetical protein